MAKGYKAHQERVEALNLLGRDLARRAKSKCEVCTEGGKSLTTYEVPPEVKQPELDRTILVCETCLNAAHDTGKKLVANDWRVLANNLWTEVPAAQVVIVRLLKRLEADGTAWARETLEEAYLDEEIEEWVTALK